MDHRGTVVAITDANANIQTSYTQDAFGRQLASVGGADPAVPNILGYQTNWTVLQIGGKWYGISKYRIYDFELGVFISWDLLRFINRYRAFSNNPVNQVDRDGLEDSEPNQHLFWYVIKDSETIFPTPPPPPARPPTPPGTRPPYALENPGVPFVPGQPVGSTQTGVDPNTLRAGDQKTLDPRSYPRPSEDNITSQVNSEGYLTNTTHRTTQAIDDRRPVDVEIKPDATGKGPPLDDLQIRNGPNAGSTPRGLRERVPTGTRVCGWFGKAFLAVNIYETIVDVGEGAMESNRTGSLQPFARSVAREAGGWAAGYAGSLEGAEVGLAFGFETGPGAFAFAAIGAVIGGIIGYTGVDAMFSNPDGTLADVLKDPTVQELKIDLHNAYNIEDYDERNKALRNIVLKYDLGE